MSVALHTLLLYHRKASVPRICSHDLSNRSIVLSNRSIVDAITPYQTCPQAPACMRAHHLTAPTNLLNRSSSESVSDLQPGHCRYSAVMIPTRTICRTHPSRCCDNTTPHPTHNAHATHLSSRCLYLVHTTLSPQQSCRTELYWYVIENHVRHKCLT